MKIDDPTAPGALETVRQFVNSLDIENQLDDIATPQTLSGWMSAHALLTADTALSTQDVQRAQLLRESLRECLLANHERQPPPETARAKLNEIAVRAQLSLVLDPAGTWQAQPLADGADGALGQMLAIVTASMNAGEWDRMKACLNDSCRWAFYDHSRARTGRWCSMQVCGNRAKQRAWRDRRSRVPC